jgi:hypothetical protein
VLYTFFRENIVLLAQNHLLLTVLLYYIGYAIDHKIHNTFIDLQCSFTLIKTIFCDCCSVC